MAVSHNNHIIFQMEELLYIEYYSNILYFIVLQFIWIAAVFGCLKWNMKHKYMEKSTTLKTIVLVFLEIREIFIPLKYTNWDNLVNSSFLT